MRLTINDKLFRKIQREVNQLTAVKIKVGFEGGEETSIAAFQEFGTVNIPARPFMRTAIAMGDSAIVATRKRLIKAVFEGRMLARTASDTLAEFIRNLIIKRIDTASSWAVPLEASTVAAKGSSAPLVDTGKMRDALKVRVVLR